MIRFERYPTRPCQWESFQGGHGSNSESLEQAKWDNAYLRGESDSKQRFSGRFLLVR